MSHVQIHKISLKLILTTFIGQYWTVNERRELLEDFARNKGFDPKLISNWYVVKREELLPFKVFVVIINIYNII